MPDPDKVRLLHGPYRAPALRVGQREACLVRDQLCKVTSWTDARIPWPRGVPVGGTGQPSIIVTEELARAIRCESAAALMFHWRVGVKVVWKWRKALGVTRTNCEGTARLRKAVSETIGDLLRGEPLPEERCDRMSVAARANNQGRYLREWVNPKGWRAEEVALLGTDDDEVIAERLGRSRSAVRSKRASLGVPYFRYRKGPRGKGRAGGAVGT